MRELTRRLGVLGLALAALAIVAVAFESSASGSDLNVTGTWQVTFDCTAGPCKGPTLSDALTLNETSGSATVTGSDSTGAGIDGALTGRALTLTATGLGRRHGVTVHITATVSADGRSFSGRFTDSKGESGSAAGTLTSGGATTSKPTTTKQAAVAAVVSGTVSVEQHGSSSFKQLSGSTPIPVGATVDATHGTIRLTTANGSESGEFYGGEFTIGEPRDGVTELTLAGGVACAGQASATGSHKPLMKRSLWGDAHEKFTTTGQAAAATVLGTRWLVTDTCSGTTVRVATGEVRVTNLLTNQSELLFAPHSYSASE